MNTRKQENPKGIQKLIEIETLKVKELLQIRGGDGYEIDKDFD